LNLSLDHARVADRVGRGHGLVDGGGRTARRDRHPVSCEELFSLVLEEIHG
jgi:hypothetical protein